MSGWMTAIICFAIVVISILISSLVKIIMKKVAEANGNTLDCQKFEYLYASISLILSAVGVFCFLKFFAGVEKISDLIKYTTLYAGSVQTVYLFVVQLIRKGGSGILALIIKIFSKIKTSTNPVEELPEIINSEVKTENKNSETVENENSTKNIKKVSEEFEKILSQI